MSLAGGQLLRLTEVRVSPPTACRRCRCCSLDPSSQPHRHSHCQQHDPKAKEWLVVGGPLLSRTERYKQHHLLPPGQTPNKTQRRAGLENKTEKFKAQPPRPTVPVWFHRTKLTPRTHNTRTQISLVATTTKAQSAWIVDRGSQYVSLEPFPLIQSTRLPLSSSTQARVRIESQTNSKRMTGSAQSSAAGWTSLSEA
jgi:hypothetical protein